MSLDPADPVLRAKLAILRDLATNIVEVVDKTVERNRADAEAPQLAIVGIVMAVEMLDQLNPGLMLTVSRALAERLRVQGRR